MKFQLLIIFACVTAALSEDCNTPEEPVRGGVCKSLQECDELKMKIKKKKITALALKTFKCANHDSLFCCPIHGEASNWKAKLEQLCPQTKCGRDSLYRIKGGTETEVNEFPWTVMLQYQDKSANNKIEHACGGSLINKRYVLTAAHCVLKMGNLELKRVRIGEWKISTTRDCSKKNPSFCAPPVIDNNIVSTDIHPQYVVDSQDQSHDIALLRLAKILTFNEFVKPICLPMDDAMKKMNYVDETMVVAGWGKTESANFTDVKMKVEIEGTEWSTCEKKFIAIGRKISYTHYCVGGKNNNKDSCNGDSGGPLMYHNTDAPEPYWYLAGIVSFGHKECDTSYPGLYTKVVDYIQWISNTIRD